MIPYVEVPTLDLDLPVIGTLRLSIFGALVATGIVLGNHLASRFGRARGIDPRKLQRLSSWAVVVGLACAHWVSALGYYPERVAVDPWLLLRFFDGLSSVGGFIGGTVAFVWLTRGDDERWSLADTLMYGFVAGFTVGRLGCALVHDHPGVILDAAHPLAVGPWPDGVHRIDLGLIEFAGMCVLSAVTYLRRWAHPGELTLSVALLYGMGRFALDFLRAHDLRHFGLTIAQWAVLVFVVGCVVGLSRLRNAFRLGLSGGARGAETTGLGDRDPDPRT